MATFTSIVLKLKGMRKAQSFLLYPYDGGDTILLQSDTRIMRLNLRTGQAYMSASHANGSHGPDLCAERGAYDTEISSEDLQTVQGYLWNNAGDQEYKVRGTTVLIIENKPLFSEAHP
jgi:hypothetical protein